MKKSYQAGSDGKCWTAGNASIPENLETYQNQRMILIQYILARFVPNYGKTATEQERVDMGNTVGEIHPNHPIQKRNGCFPKP